LDFHDLEVDARGQPVGQARVVEREQGGVDVGRAKGLG
jgi:hypothetical protein